MPRHSTRRWSGANGSSPSSGRRSRRRSRTRRVSSSRSSGRRASASPVWSRSSSPASATARWSCVGRCLPYGEGITYYPVVEAIKQAAGLADFDLPEVVEAKVCAVLEGEEHQELVCRHVAQLMGIAESAARRGDVLGDPPILRGIARDRPLVLVFDDVHWGEPTFLDLVEHIADWSRGSPILLLCMARADLLDVRPGWGGGKLNAATVSLEPLTEEQAGALVANLLGSAELAGRGRSSGSSGRPRAIRCSSRRPSRC